MHHLPVYKEIVKTCEQRDECYSTCVSDNFPYMDCERVKLNLEFDGVTYSDFFVYPAPNQDNPNFYNKCKGYIKDNYS